MAARFEIGAERLFKADADIGPGQAAGGKPGDGRLEEARRGREEDGEPFLRCSYFGGKINEVAGVVGVERLIMQAVEEFRHRSAPFGRQVFLQRLTSEIAITGIVEWLARRADNLELRRDQLVGPQRTERRQEHALRQIASGAKQQQTIGIEAHLGCTPVAPQLVRVASG